MTFRAEVRRTMVLEFDFEEDEIEEGDDEFVAAQELSLSFPFNLWDEEYFDVDVVKIED